jgi:hypothetical protein
MRWKKMSFTFLIVSNLASPVPTSAFPLPLEVLSFFLLEEELVDPLGVLVPEDLVAA